METNDHKTRSHAKVSPSAAERWMHCPVAPTLEAEMPDESSPEADEGTGAHEVAEIALQAQRSPEAATGGDLNGYVKIYTDLVLDAYTAAKEAAKTAKLITETRVDLSDWIPEGSGIVDAAVISPRELHVFDLKYGLGVRVDAYRNPQLMCYALGLLNKYPRPRVILTVVQPRLEDGITEYQTTRMELKAWGEQELRPKALAAFNGEGRACCGSWCRFCRAKGICREYNLDIIRMERTDSAMLSDAEIEQLLPEIPHMKKALDALNEYALSRALDSENPKHWRGMEVAEGRTLRTYTSREAAVAAYTAAGITDIWKPQELRSVADMEKQIGKKEFAKIAETCVVKPTGKPTLVPAKNTEE